MEYIKRKRLWITVRCLKEIIILLKEQLKMNQYEVAAQILESFQNQVILVGEQIEKYTGESSNTIKQLEQLCEEIYATVDLCGDKEKEELHCDLLASRLEQALAFAKEELNLNKTILAYHVDLLNCMNEVDLLGNKLDTLDEMVSSNDNILVYWAVNFDSLKKRALLRKGYTGELQELLYEYQQKENFIVEFHETVEDEAEIADAFYGDAGELSDRMLALHKPVMIQDLHFEEGNDNYIKSDMLKQVQQAELDLLKELKRVCDKYDIQFFAAYGTMMGVVRHKGFIPWDDDTDVFMFRKEYEKLVQVAEKEFTGKYFFQNAFTDENCLFPAANLRNSETTAILLKSSKTDVNLGIFLDIFILDSLPDDPQKVEEECLMLREYYDMYIDRMYYKLGREDLISKKGHEYFENIRREDFIELVKECDRKRSKYDRDDTTYITPFGSLVMANSPVAIFERKWFEKTIMLPFEDMELPVPAGYDEFLRYHYGFYRKPIRESSTHGDTMFDTERSYKEYV